MGPLNGHWLIIIRSCNLKHLQYVNMIARKKILKKLVLHRKWPKTSRYNFP